MISATRVLSARERGEIDDVAIAVGLYVATSETGVFHCLDKKTGKRKNAGLFPDPGEISNITHLRGAAANFFAGPHVARRLATTRLLLLLASLDRNDGKARSGNSRSKGPSQRFKSSAVVGPTAKTSTVAGCDKRDLHEFAISAPPPARSRGLLHPVG